MKNNICTKLALTVVSLLLVSQSVLAASCRAKLTGQLESFSTLAERKLADHNFTFPYNPDDADYEIAFSLDRTAVMTDGPFDGQSVDVRVTQNGTLVDSVHVEGRVLIIPFGPENPSHRSAIKKAISRLRICQP